MVWREYEGDGPGQEGNHEAAGRLPDGGGREIGN